VLVAAVAAVPSPAAANGSTIAWGSLPEGAVPGLSLDVRAVEATSDRETCAITLSIRNRFALALDRIILDLVLEDEDGGRIAAGQAETGTLPSGEATSATVALSREDGTFSCSQATGLKVVPRACSAGPIDLFDACRAGLGGTAEAVRLSFDRKAEPYPFRDDGVLDRPGYRASDAKATEVVAAGLTLSAISARLAERFAVGTGTEGSLVVAVAAGSAAAAAGILAGDVIVEVDQESAVDTQAAAATLGRSLAAGRPALLLIERDGAARFLVLGGD